MHPMFQRAVHPGRADELLAEEDCRSRVSRAWRARWVHRTRSLHCETSIPALIGGVVMPPGSTLWKYSQRLQVSHQIRHSLWEARVRETNT